MKHLSIALLGIAIAMPLAFADSKNFSVKPETFDPSHTNMVTAAWLGGLGCVTKGHVQAFVPPAFTTTQILPYADATCPTGDSQDSNNQGLLLAKTGPTNNNAAAGARIDGPGGNFAITELGWDVRNGTHCGAGAPRFNIHLKNEPAGTIHFVGCNAMPVVSTGLYGTRRRVTAAQLAGAGFAFPAIQQGSIVDSIEIIFDEGQDTPTAGVESGNGLVVLDNIDINGVLVGRGPGKGDGGDDGGEGKDHNDH